MTRDEFLKYVNHDDDSDLGFLYGVVIDPFKVVGLIDESGDDFLSLVRVIKADNYWEANGEEETTACFDCDEDLICYNILYENVFASGDEAEKCKVKMLRNFFDRGLVKVLASENAKNRAFRTGDKVHHNPTDEDWIVAAVFPEIGEMSWIGYPEGFAKIEDCVLVEACSEEQHLRWLKNMAAMRNQKDHRRRYAKIKLESYSDRGLPPPSRIPPTPPVEDPKSSVEVQLEKVFEEGSRNGCVGVYQTQPITEKMSKKALMGVILYLIEHNKFSERMLDSTLDAFSKR